MVSFDARQMLGTIISMIGLGVVAASSATLAQPESSPAAEDAVQDLIAEIDEIQSLRGSSSRDLLEPLTALSLLYEERGDYELALAVIEEATRVVEVNDGLQTLDEARLMRQSIRIQRARGNAEVAWKEEQELLVLIRRRRHQGDARTIDMLHEIADGRRVILARYRAGDLPPEIVLGCYYSEWAYDGNGNPRRTGCNSGNRDTVIRALRREASGLDGEANAKARRVARWVESPCMPLEASVMTGERRLKRREKEDMQAYFLAVSDYGGCTQAKYLHAASTSASPEELSRLASDMNTAAEALATQAAIYDERFGR